MPWATEDARVLFPEPGMPATAMRRRVEAETVCSFSVLGIRFCGTLN